MIERGQIWKRKWWADLYYFFGPFLPKYVLVKSLEYSAMDERLLGVLCIDADEGEWSYTRKYELPTNGAGTRITGFKLYKEAEDDD